jgi:hypothetical protein
VTSYTKAWKRENSERLARRRRELYAEQNGARHKELERLRAVRAPYRVTAENLMSGIRERASRHGYDVAPQLRTKAFIEEWLKRQPDCECCGVRLRVGNKGNGCKSDDSASFDRFDLRHGYTLNNTRLICWRCNNIKRNYTASDLRMVADWIDQTSHQESTSGNNARTQRRAISRSSAIIGV